MKICVYGAGNIGCYVGGRLLATGAHVEFVARARFAVAFEEYGLRLTDFEGADLIAGGRPGVFSEKAETARSADLVLVTVKSAATESVGKELARVLKPNTVVISFQNGLGNADLLRGLLPDCTVLAGMVPFNVIGRGEGRFHKGTAGHLAVQKHHAVRPSLAAFERAGLPLELHEDIVKVQWAKLLLNLNNPVNALSGLPLKEELSQRGYRRCLALAQRETLEIFAAAGIRPAKLTPLPPGWIPGVLELPDFLFRRVAGKMLAIDPLARSSMQDDLTEGRKTEVDWLNGEIVRLAASVGRKAPVNARLLALIKEAEEGKQLRWTGEALLACLEDA